MRPTFFMNRVATFYNQLLILVTRNKFISRKKEETPKTIKYYATNDDIFIHNAFLLI